MPTYEYRCVSCEHQFERFQRMSDDPVKECEVCGEPVKRLFFPVAIQFKGNGFYSTDYGRRSTLAAGGNASGNGGESDASSAQTASAEGGGSSERAKKAAADPAKPVTASAGAKND